MSGGRTGLRLDILAGVRHVHVPDARPDGVATGAGGR